MLVTLTVLGGVPLFYNVAMPPENRGLSCSSWCSEGESSLNRGQYDTYKEHIQNQEHHTHVYSLWNIFTFKSMSDYHKISCRHTIHSHSFRTAYCNRIDFLLYNAAFFACSLFLLIFYLFNVVIWWSYFWWFFFFYSLVKKLSLPRVVVREIPKGNGRWAPHLLRCRHQQFT